MKTLMDRYKSLQDEEETLEFVQEFLEMDSIQEQTEDIKEAHPVMLPHMLTAYSFIGYLLAKMSELEDEIINLKSQTHNLT